MARFYIDHDVSRYVATLLRQSRHDACAAFDVGLASVHDGIQLMTAARQRRILVTHNWKDFLLLHRGVDALDGRVASDRRARGHSRGAAARLGG